MNKQKNKKKVIAFLLSMLMLISLFQNISYTPIAEGGETESVASESDANFATGQQSIGTQENQNGVPLEEENLNETSQNGRRSTPGEDGGDGACDHAADAKQQQHRLDTRGGEHVDTDDLVDDLDEKHDIPLGHHAGQDARGGRGGLAVGIRHPQVEGEQAAFDGQSRRYQAQGHGHGEPVPAGGP